MVRRLVASYLALVALALALFTVPEGIGLVNALRGNQAEVGLREARTVAVLLATADAADPDSAAGADLALLTLRSNLEEQTGGRVELLSADGRPALGRPVSNPLGVDIGAALQGRETVTRTDDSVLGEPGLQVTVPSNDPNGTTVGAVRLTYPSAPVTAQIKELFGFQLIVALATLGIAAAAAWWLARSMTRPLRLLDGMARSLSRGDFAARTDPLDAGPEETRRVAESMNDAARRISDLIDAKRQFVADASHQLRTPLTALRLSLDNLQDEVSDPDARAAVDRSIADTVRMTRLVHDLLTLARAQKPIDRPTTVDVQAVVDERLATWSAAASAHGVELVSCVPAGTRAVLGDGHLEQFLDNVLANAVDVAPPGTDIVVDAAVGGESLRLTITDRGPGLSAEDRRRALDRFWTRRPGGSGLGLSIVDQLARENRGSLSLEPNADGGLIVVITLPTSTPLRTRPRPSGSSGSTS
ncbi:HAMP domain-containing sensor histidine kinase [Rhodococcus sp. SORGH_AS_0303]|uniref:sensor histidine kinase n=1 Tax=Rhodococcus sp. SORGH_AS_0303 TaxID=3041753 RepID=UPI0027877863|nr:HAMP domain-containing sensor histidine kinase [Rhodococcus sp. SORGH_AS_0303]MDQ1200753.1 two-component system OmpR family sensor kinase [Rhodococcus sp. SORGH_AS_0303]